MAGMWHDTEMQATEDLCYQDGVDV